MSMPSPGPLIHEIDWLTPFTREALLLAQQEAAQAGLASIQPEHLLLGVLIQGETKAATLLFKSGLDTATLHAHIEAIYSSNPLSKDPSPSLSQKAEECVEHAIAMITYYLTRHRPSAKVAPEHLVLSVISHPDTQLLITYPTQIASLRQQLIAEMKPDFLRHIAHLFLPPEQRPTPDYKGPIKKIAADRSALRCPSCLYFIQPHWKHCAYCGHGPNKKCKECGTPYPNVRGAKFCTECGANLV